MKKLKVSLDLVANLNLFVVSAWKVNKLRVVIKSLMK